MSRCIRRRFAIVAGILLALPAYAQNKVEEELSRPKPAPANPGFEKLKSLAGEWTIVGEPVHKDVGATAAQPEVAAKDAKTGGGDTAKPAGTDQPAKTDKAAAGATCGQAKGASGGQAGVGGSAACNDAKKMDDTPTIVYSVIAAGSAVHEHMFPGGPHEMVTVYHLDGPDLLLTHYCAAGNKKLML